MYRPEKLLPSFRIHFSGNLTRIDKLRSGLSINYASPTNGFGHQQAAHPTLASTFDVQAVGLSPSLTCILKKSTSHPSSHVQTSMEINWNQFFISNFIACWYTTCKLSHEYPTKEGKLSLVCGPLIQTQKQPTPPQDMTCSSLPRQLVLVLIRLLGLPKQLVWILYTRTIVLALVVIPEVNNERNSSPPDPHNPSAPSDNIASRMYPGQNLLARKGAQEQEGGKVRRGKEKGEGRREKGGR